MIHLRTTQLCRTQIVKGLESLSFLHYSHKRRNESDRLNKEETPRGGTESLYFDIEKSQLKLYEDHQPINKLQRTALSVGAAITSLVDPARHDMIAVLGETTGHKALSNIYEQMKADPEGITIIEDRPRINSQTVDISALSRLPNDTLGFAYTQFLSRNSVTPDSRLPTRFVDDVDLAYIMQRYREGHDLVHTTLGMPTNMLGEVAVKWVEALQTGLPMCIGGALFGPIRLRPKQRAKYITSLLPWAIKVGRSAKPLMNIYFEKRWHQKLDDLRAEFNIEPPPSI